MLKLKKHKQHSAKVLARRKRRKAMLLKQGEELKRKYGKQQAASPAEVGS